jgi:Domain of unknown function (DUF4249)
MSEPVALIIVMKYMTSRSLLFFFIIFLVSCEKNIDIKLDETKPKLVVDGSIENDRPPFIVLSKSLDYFGELSPAQLEASFVHKAKITITVGTRVYSLREDSSSLGNGFQYFFYTTDVSDPVNALLGQLNTSYSLKIVSSGATYTSTTQIPEITRRIDSLWSEPVSGFEDTTLARLMIRATDRPGFGDYIRYFTKANTDLFYPGYNSVFDDQVIDGKTYTIQVDRGLNKNLNNKDEDIYFHKGDIVTLKLCNIDRNTFNFWRTFEFNFQGIGNPFSSPTIVTSNISNGALGYFGGYAAQFKTILIPR